MNYSSSNTDVSKQRTECAVVFCKGKDLLPSAVSIDKECGGVLTTVLKNGDVGSKAGQNRLITLLENTKEGKNTRPYARVLLVQLGKALAAKGKNNNTFNEKGLLGVLNGLARLLAKIHFKDAAVFFDGIEIKAEGDEPREQSWIVSTLAQKIEYAAYHFSLKKPKDKKQSAFNKLTVNLGAGSVAQAKKALSIGEALGKGINLAREMGNLPGNICTPTRLAEEAAGMARQYEKLSARSLGEKQMAKLGMHSLLSVSQGSAQEAKLIILEYKGATKDKPHVLVGKGITFDTGGISLKPAATMDEMKFDMCGAASVLGTIKALAEMKARVHVVGIIAAAENMPSDRASRPGDIVTSMSGQTIEILNTDAEGRLVLCDALSYAERFNPASLVDIATLTGACVVALGAHATGLYANDQKLANALLESGQRANDKAWQMPLWDEYQKQLDSNFADIANIGGPKAGSVTAACFLSRFTKKQRWAHLDIAGTAWNSGGAKGSTGRPVSLLVDYLLNN